jgi:hypothetical protein
MLSNEKMLTLLTKTTEPSARLAGTKRNIHELFDDLTLTVETKKPKTSWLRHEDVFGVVTKHPSPPKPPLTSILDDDLSLELSSMSMTSSSSSSSSPPPQPPLLDLDDDVLRHIASFLDPDDRRKLALTSHDAHRVIASA